MSPAPFLALGLGNELLRDEGLGVVAARRLAERGLPDVDVVDGGTLGIGLLAELEGRHAVVALDAVTFEGAAPGEIITIDRHELPTAQRLFATAHDVGLLHTLEAAELCGTAPAHVAVVGMVPGSMDPGYGLSALILDRLDELVDAAVHLLTVWRLEREVLRA